MLEKYDGVRAFWNPQNRCFYSRTGLKKNLPQDIIDSMPNIFLDGELWYFYPSPSQHICLSFTIYHLWLNGQLIKFRFGRDNFEESMKLVNKIDTSTLDWKNFQFMVFDQPNHPGTYQQRFNSIGITLPLLPTESPIPSRSTPFVC